MAAWLKRRRSVAVVTLLALVPVGVGAARVAGGGSDDASRAGERAAAREDPALRPRPKIVQITGVGTDDWPDADEQRPPRPSSPPSDAEVEAELSSFRRHLRSAGLARGAQARVAEDGSAVAPSEAPAVVAQVVQAANEIARAPYRWGGGHGRWRDSGYDCSGSISFALAGAGLLDRPLDSSSFSRWGDEGEGRWITVYTNPGHAFMVVAGLRFDTSGRGRSGTRWQGAPRSVGGYTVRHPPGL